jgi:hypothetical protein
MKLTSLVAKGDFVLIDGDHSYEIIRADSANTHSVIAKDGLIVWDDYKPRRVVGMREVE